MPRPDVHGSDAASSDRREATLSREGTQCCSSGPAPWIPEMFQKASDAMRGDLHKLFHEQQVELQTLFQHQAVKIEEWISQSKEMGLVSTSKEADPTCSMTTTKTPVPSMRPVRQGSTTEDAEREAALAIARANQTKYRVTVLAQESTITIQPTYQRVLERLHKLVTSSNFETFCGVAVVLNAVLVGAEVQYAVSTPSDHQADGFVVLSYTFCAIFTVELILRALAHRWNFIFDAAQRSWNILDTTVVILSLAELIVDIASQNEKGMDLSNFGVLRTARILKVIRLARMVRILRFAHDLRILLLSITCTLRQLFWAMMLLSVIIYMFAIVFTQAVADFLRTPEGLQMRADMALELSSRPNLLQYFGSLGLSSRTLFESISGGVSWHDPLLALVEIGEHWSFFFLIYIAFTFFAVLNVVTGVFCNSAIEAAQLDHEMVIQSQMSERNIITKRFVELFARLDDDYSGTITVDEFQKHLDDPQVQTYLASLDLSVQEAWLFFKMLDTDGTHEVDLSEFIEGCMMLRGQAKNFDIKCVMYENKMLIQRVRRIIEMMEHGDVTPQMLKRVAASETGQSRASKTS